MTLRTHTIEKKNPKHKQIWEWEETPELVDVLLRLDTSTELLNRIKVPKLHVGTNNFAKPRKRVVK